MEYMQQWKLILMTRQGVDSCHTRRPSLGALGTEDYAYDDSYNGQKHTTREIIQHQATIKTSPFSPIKHNRTLSNSLRPLSPFPP